MGAVSLAAFWNDSIVVETWLGEDGQGRDRYAAAVTIYGYSEQRRTLVQNGDSGLAVAQTMVYCDKAYAGAFTVGTRVTIGGIVSKVITSSVFGSTGLPLPEHVQVALG